MDMDEEFWQGIEEVEEKVRGIRRDTSSDTSASGPSTSRSQRQVAPPQLPRNAALIGGGRGAGRPAPAEIIELDDSDEEKENVSTRLKRRAVAPSRIVDTIDLSD